MIKVLFVCLGNICRSPLAEGVLADLAAKAGLRLGQDGDLVIDSAGLLGYHAGAAPDSRSVTVAARHDIDISGQRCRQVEEQDFLEFDYILGMDAENIAHLKSLSPPEAGHKIHLFLPFARDLRGIREIPDPYLAPDLDAFERVYDFIERAARGFLDHIMDEHALHPPQRQGVN